MDLLLIATILIAVLGLTATFAGVDSRPWDTGEPYLVTD